MPVDQVTKGGAPAAFDPATYRPCPVPEVLVFDRSADEPEARYYLTTAGATGGVLLSAEDKRLWDLFDGQRSVNDVCVAALDAQRSLATARLYGLLQELGQAGLLTEPAPFAPPETASRRWPGLPARLSFRLPETRLLVGALAPVFRLLQPASFWTVATVVLVAVVGLVLASTAGDHGAVLLMNWPPLPRNAIPGTVNALGLLVLLGLHLGLSLGRHLVTAAVEAAFSRRPTDLEFGLYCGGPGFGCPNRWLAALPRRQRLVVSGTGVACDLILAAAAAAALRWELPPTARALIGTLLWVAYLRVLLHLSPLSISDLHLGFAALAPFLAFRRRLWGFLRHGFVEALLLKHRISREEQLYLLFILITLGWLVAAVNVLAYLSATQPFMVTDLLWSRRVTVETDALVVGLVWSLPMVLGLLLSAVWMVATLGQYLARLPVLREANNLLLVVGLPLLGVVGLAGLLAEATAARVLSLLAGVTVVVGVIVARAAQRAGARSECGRQFAYVLVSWFAFGVARVVGPGLGQPAAAGFFSALALMLLVPPLALMFNPQRGLWYAWRTAFTAADLVYGAGLVLLAAALGARVALGPVLPGRLVAIEQLEVAGMVLVVLATVALWQLLSELEVPGGRLELDQHTAETPVHLARIGTWLEQQLGAALAARVGAPGCQAVALEVARGLGVPAFTFAAEITPGPTLEATAQAGRARLLALDRALVRLYGAAFRNRLLGTLCHRLNYQAHELLHQHLLTDTALAGDDGPGAPLTAAECAAVIDRSTFFQELGPDLRYHLGRRLTIRCLPAGAALVRRYEAATEAFLVIAGEVQVEDQDCTGQTHAHVFLGAADFFGEAALLDAERRLATVRAVTPVRLLVLHREAFGAFAAEHPDQARALREHFAMLHSLFQMELFADLPGQLLYGILPELTTVRFSDGQDIVRQGEAGAEMYLIQSGHVAVLDRGPGGAETQVNALGPRSWFGEIALLADIPRTMTVRSLGPTVLLRLSRQGFQRLVGSSRLFAAGIATTGRQRRNHRHAADHGTG